MIEAQLEERAADRARQEELREQARHNYLSTPSVRGDLSSNDQSPLGMVP